MRRIKKLSRSASLKKKENKQSKKMIEATNSVQIRRKFKVQSQCFELLRRLVRKPFVSHSHIMITTPKFTV